MSDGDAQILVVATLVLMFSAASAVVVYGVTTLVRQGWRRRYGRCVRCGYDLHALSGSRCPECGHPARS